MVDFPFILAFKTRNQSRASRCVFGCFTLIRPHHTDMTLVPTSYTPSQSYTPLTLLYLLFYTNVQCRKSRWSRPFFQLFISISHECASKIENKFPATKKKCQTVREEKKSFRFCFSFCRFCAFASLTSAAHPSSPLQRKQNKQLSFFFTYKFLFSVQLTWNFFVHWS